MWRHQIHGQEQWKTLLLAPHNVKPTNFSRPKDNRNMNRIEKQKIGMQQNNHPYKEVSETINQTPKLHNQKKKKTTISQIKTQKPKTNKKHIEK